MLKTEYVFLSLLVQLVDATSLNLGCKTGSLPGAASSSGASRLPGAMVTWRYGVLVIWCPGAGATVPWCHGEVDVTWSLVVSRSNWCRRLISCTQAWVALAIAEVFKLCLHSWQATFPLLTFLSEMQFSQGHLIL